MLTKCPKCGFSQPKDQYCAQCGVDMTAYKPPEKSLFQKLSENLFVQLALVICLGIVAVSMITRNQKENFWTRVHFLRGTSIQVSQSKDSNQFSVHNLDVQAQPAQEENVAEASLPAAAPTASDGKAKTIAGPKTSVYYLEIPHEVLNKWLEDGLLSRVETTDEVTTGYIPQLSQLLEQYKSQIKVLKQESYAYNLNQLYTAKLERTSDTSSSNGRMVASTESAQGTTAPPPPPAITTYATLDDDRNETLTGQLEVSTNPQASFPAQFEMSADQSFFIAGFDKTNRSRNPSSSETLVVLKIDK